VSDSSASYKRESAEAALEQVDSGMTVGLGTGSTAAFVISGLGERLADGRLERVQGIPTSVDTERLARAAGVPLVQLGRERIDVAIDGCDEVDASLRLIKGLGGALTREKLVAAAAERFIVVADDSKYVQRLGEKAPVPVEIVPFGYAATVQRLEAFGDCELRLDSSGEPLRTDNGNLIVDVRPPERFDPASLAAELKGTLGVVEHGLFLGLATEAILAGSSGIQVLKR